jgi:leader peptidase (prepilin peptidase)/N-methyltransferase
VSDHWVLWGGGVFAAIYGLVIGSFLAVCIVRMPEDRSLLVPSSCPRCGARVRWTDNVPVFSWLWLKGRCRDCGGRISPLHPLVEALTAVLAVLVYRQVFLDPGDLDLAHIVAWVYRFGFVSLLLIAGAVDIRHRIIPDQTSIYAVPFGVAGAALLAWLDYHGQAAPMALSWQLSVFGAAVCGLFLMVPYAVTRLLWGVEALGWGDVKLVAMMGAFLGLYPAPLFVLLAASLSGAAVGLGQIIIWRRRTGLPLGPHLAGAGIAYVLYGDLLLKALLPGIVW